MEPRSAPHGRDAWRRALDDATLRDGDVDTHSGIPVEPAYGPDDGLFPGQWPYTRGPYTSMYRSKLWTMRMFAGFGTAPDTNRRFHDLLDAGGDGLSTAFDLPTLMGRDSDDPLAEGEVGRCGVAVDTLVDVEDLYRGIDLGNVTTSMTINSPAAVLLAMYVAAAEAGGTARQALGGTLQNDILKEYQAQKEFVRPAPPRSRSSRSRLRTALRTSKPVSMRGLRSTTSRPDSASSSTRTSTSSRRSRSTAPRVVSGPAGYANATAPNASARCSCVFTHRRPASR
jgi:methylmalonyl-CoA mutase N-terminal domain/subunit